MGCQRVGNNDPNSEAGRFFVFYAEGYPYGPRISTKQANETSVTRKDAFLRGSATLSGVGKVMLLEVDDTLPGVV